MVKVIYYREKKKRKRKTVIFLKVSRLRPLVFLVKIGCRCDSVEGKWIVRQ